jgi:hypothetical protein
MHPRAFRVAEQSLPDYVRACQWLHLKALRDRMVMRRVSKRSAYWRQVLAPLYGCDYVAYVAARKEART